MNGTRGSLCAHSLSFVTCSSNDHVLKSNLLASACLREGSPHNVAVFKGCKSAAEGLNLGIERAQTDWVLCLHEDVHLPANWEVKVVDKLVEAEQRFGPIGVAGIYGVGPVIQRQPGNTPPNDGPSPISNLTAERFGWVSSRDVGIREEPELPARVSTLDELLLILPKDTLLRFDPALGFHLYGADLCLQAAELGLAVVAIEAPCKHNTRHRTIPEVFLKSAEVFARKWRHRLPIATTCAIIDEKAQVWVLGSSSVIGGPFSAADLEPQTRGQHEGNGKPVDSPPEKPAPQVNRFSCIADRYLHVVQEILINAIYQDQAIDPWSPPVFDERRRDLGLDWPHVALTMIGRTRLRSLRECCETVLRDGVPGDFVETGIWRGGACIMMAAVLAAYERADRRVWGFDSFEGLPPPDEERYPQDHGDQLYRFPQLAVSREEVTENFRRLGLWSDQVQLVKGWFADTVPTAAIGQIAVLRLDGDLYESTIQVLDGFYPKLSPGGFCIIDDYGAMASCRLAVDDFRRDREITEPIVDIDGKGILWRKRGES
jgi:O-methyltransferase